MYFLYLDDSGSPGNPDESHFVLAGFVVHEERLRWLSSQLDLYAQEIVPGNPKSVEFHAAECFRAVESPWKEMQRKDRIGVIKGVLERLHASKPPIAIIACAIHKASFPGQDPVTLAYEDLSSRFNSYLDHRITDGKKPRGMIVIDKSSYELGLQNLAADIRDKGNKWGNQLRNICEVPLFVDSKASRLIQAADHIAYAIHRRYNQNDLTYFNLIEDRFDQHDGVLHGLVHIQHYNPKCTCPACITRK